MEQSVRPKAPWHVSATKEGSYLLFANANCALGTCIESVRVCWHLFDSDIVKLAIRREACALSELPGAVHANAGDSNACHRDEFVKQILWLRASGAGLSPSKIDAVNYDDQVVALLHSPQRDAIRKVDVHAVFGSLYEARCACRLLLGTFAGLIRAVSLLYAVHCMCEALCKLRGAICANIRAAWTCERTRSTRRRVCVCHLCCLRVRWLDGHFVRFVIPFCFDTLALPILTCT